MKAITVILALALIVGCKKEATAPRSIEAQPTQPASIVPIPGQVIFYYNGGIAAPQITVNIAQQTAQVTTFYAAGTPSCGTPGCATFALTAGNYTWSATNNISAWAGTVSVSQGNCSAKLLQ